MVSPTPSFDANSTQVTSNAVPSEESDASSGRPKPESLKPDGSQKTASGASSKSYTESGRLVPLNEEALGTPGVKGEYRFDHDDAPGLDWTINMDRIEMRHNVYHMITSFEILGTEPSDKNNAEQSIVLPEQVVTCHGRYITPGHTQTVDNAPFGESLMGNDQPFVQFLRQIHCSTAYSQQLTLSLLQTYREHALKKTTFRISSKSWGETA